MIGLYLKLFWTYFLIGTFTIGGGYAMLSLIQNQVVNVHSWISDSMFTDIVAISQMTPGPIGINTATYVGYSVLHEAGASQAACILGSFTATAAVVLPSVFIMMIIVKTYLRLHDSQIFQNIMTWLKPTVTGLIGAAALILITPENFSDWKSWCICLAAFVAAFWGKAHPILIIVSGALLGILLF